MTKDNVQDTAAAALLSEKINEVRELKIRCSQQENQLTTMSGLLQLTREDNRKLRIILRLAIMKFDQFKEQDEEFQKYVAKSKQRIDRLLNSCEEDDDSISS